MKNYKVTILSLKNLHDSNIKMSAIFFDEERPEVSHWLNDLHTANIIKQNRFATILRSKHDVSSTKIYAK